ncbi:MAG: carbohydrate binding domain-containing protein [Phycisphaerae bacterium]|nr:carbohydrate binding domain-containing protein [Phycisphaerae bacterium]
MRRTKAPVLFAIALVLSLAAGRAEASDDAKLPPGVTSVWDIAKAHRESTATREHICINGLWRWQPAKEPARSVPDGKWGYFKVPGSWPGITNYMQKDSQTVHAHPSWKGKPLGGITSAWYQREITIPAGWAGRRITLRAEYLNSFAAAYVDGKKVGEMRFPAGEVDITSICKAGGTHVLSLAVVAMPLKGVMLSYNDTASARKVKGAVARRGLCGDVYLVGSPQGLRIADVKIDTSVRKGRITFGVAVDSPAANTQYALRAHVMDGARRVAEFKSKAFRASDLKSGRIEFTHKWKPGKLWDIHTPNHTYIAGLSLLDAKGKLIDAALPVRFGFREFWIDGRDFYLNGSRIHLSAVPLDNAQVGASAACYDAARESLLRLKSIGINFVYTHNYGCQPGSHLSFEEILRAADDVGMLAGVSQPHFSHYDWKARNAAKTNGYARHAAFYVRLAQNHPSVVAYSTSHNATSSGEDMNPHRFGDADIPRESWSANNTKLALGAEAIIRRLDPSRIVYHHAGDIGAMHTSNFYPNFVPIQEMSDWFEHWATRGVKPAFLCEYGAPFSWDWAMYRGWHKGKREFGSARVPWEFCLAEWNAQFLGDAAFRISEMEKANLRWEAGRVRAGKLWHRWDYPYSLGSRDIPERHTVMARYITDNWRAFRTWGLSGNSPWEHRLLYVLRDGVDKSRKGLPVDWGKLQRPGLSPDYVEDRYERMDLAFKRSDWVATPTGRAILRNNAPLLAYIAGKPGGFTSKDHNFSPGQTAAKQIVVINNSRQAVVCECAWLLALPTPIKGRKKVTVPTGEQVRIPLRFDLPEALAPGAYRLDLTASFDRGKPQKDSFTIHVQAPATKVQVRGKIALFDPKGQTGKLLAVMGVACRSVQADRDLSDCDMLIVGKGALTANSPAPDISGVRDGLKVLVFEQTSEALEKRLGFRVQEYGLRNVFRRMPDHPALRGLAAEHLRDWRGSATLLPPRLSYRRRPAHGPTVSWCGLPVTRLWRCGNRGNVASVLIEKPARGDFLPIVDGGYSLQYSPLLAYRRGKGVVVFCQMDVTGRTEPDPAARRLVGNLLTWLGQWKASPRRQAVYAGSPAGLTHLKKAGLRPIAFAADALKPDRVLIATPGAGKTLAPHKTAIARWLKKDGRVLAIGLSGTEARDFMPVNVATKRSEHLATFFPPPGAGSPMAGIGPADVHNRHPSRIDLVSGGAAIVGNGVLASAGDNVVFCQLAPWRYDHEKHYYMRRTFRRTACLVARLLGNLGVQGDSPLLARFSTPLDASGPEPNVIRNGDFRTDSDSDGLADHWQVTPGPKQSLPVRDKTAERPNRWSQRITGKGREIMLSQTGVPVEKNQWYRISLRAKSEGVKGSRVTLAVQNTSTWRSLIEYQRFAPDGSWRPFTFTVQATGSEKSKTRFQIWSSQAGTLWLSDVVMTPVDPPSKGRWLTGLYLDRPVEWDDPYRFFRW